MQISFFHFVKDYGESIKLPKLPSPMQDVHRIVARIEALVARVVEAQRLRRSDGSSEIAFRIAS